MLSSKGIGPEVANERETLSFAAEARVYGRAVSMLALLLQDDDQLDPNKEIEIDGSYTVGGKIAAAVKRLQKMEMLAQTGDLDEGTANALAVYFGIRNLEDLPDDPFAAPTVTAP